MMMSDIERNGEEIMRLQSRLSIVEDATQRQAISMARIDENIKAIRQSVEKMANDN
jgi:archaellum component FlaC